MPFETTFESWNCWENVEIMYDRCCALTLFETMFLEFKLLRKRWKQREQIVLEFETAEKILKARTRNGVFWRSLKRWKARKIMLHAFWRYSKNMVATFRGASECGKLISSSLKKLLILTYDTPWSWWHPVLFYHFQHFPFEDTPVYLQTYKTWDIR